MNMVQLMPLPSLNRIISCLILIETGLHFWYRLTQIVLENGPLNGCSSDSSTLSEVDDDADDDELV